jgi:glutamine synthetase
MLQTDQKTVIKALETSPVAAELLTPAVIEGLAAVRNYEITTYGDRPEPETTQALRLAWSC